MTFKKAIYLLLLVCIIVPFTAQATVTRVIGLGGSDANFIVKDAYNPSIWPQLIREYPNLAGGEFSAEEFQKAYINYDMGSDKCAFQISLDRSTSPRYSSGPDLSMVGGGYNKLSLIWGRKLQDMLIGVGLNYAGKSLKYDAVGEDPSRDASYTNIGLNLGLTALEKKLDASIGIDFASFSDKVGGTKVLDNDGSMTIGLAGRYWMKMSDRYALIPNIKFVNMKDSKKDNAGNKSGYTNTMFALGIGNNWTPVEDMLAIFELGLMSNNLKGTASGAAKDTEMDIYWRLGFETKIFTWLDGRFGAERNWVYETNETIQGKPKIGTNLTSTYLGASMHWNRLHLDVLVQPAFLQNGPNFISGKTTDIFNQVSLKYDFNK
jgi:hypothetical protein